MRATTVKVEGDLLKELERTKPSSLSLSAYVREILRQEIRRRKMAEAADRYVELVRDSSDEREWLTEWERADLTAPPKRRGG
jgi:hypothetical protein